MCRMRRVWRRGRWDRIIIMIDLSKDLVLNERGALELGNFRGWGLFELTIPILRHDLLVFHLGSKVEILWSLAIIFLLYWFLRLSGRELGIFIFLLVNHAVTPLERSLVIALLLVLWWTLHGWCLKGLYQIGCYWIFKVVRSLASLQVYVHGCPVEGRVLWETHEITELS